MWSGLTLSQVPTSGDYYAIDLAGRPVMMVRQADGSHNIASVNQLKSTGFPPYDQKIINTIRGEWRYRPFMVNGKAAPVCTAVTFIYSQH